MRCSALRQCCRRWARYTQAIVGEGSIRCKLPCTSQSSCQNPHSMCTSQHYTPGPCLLSPCPLRPCLADLPQDADEWRERWQPGAEVLHIELRRWADVLVIAPLSANTLAKAANGLCDNLLTCVVRAWDFSKPLLVRRAGGRVGAVWVGGRVAGFGLMVGGLRMTVGSVCVVCAR